LVAHFDGTNLDAVEHPQSVTFGNELELLGTDLNDTTFKRDATVHATLYLRALPALDRDLSTFVHLTAPDGFVLAQKDSLHPANLPTTQWDLDAYVADDHSFTIPANLAPGEYDLRAGVYDPGTNTRLLTPTGADYVLLQKIQIVE